MIRLAKSDEIEQIVLMSKEAFDSDINVGAKEISGPPMYDSLKWHYNIQKMNILYSIIENNELVGAMIIYPNNHKKGFIEIGRVFIKPIYFKKGYGSKAMFEVESMFPNASGFNLDTPVWNIRTNSFYTKLGYIAVNRNDNFVFYEKTINK